MTIPASIIDPQHWLASELAVHPQELYAPAVSTDGFGSGQPVSWPDLVQFQPDELERLVLIDVAGDPVYKAFEIQQFRTPGGIRGTAIAARKDGTVDYYYQSGVPMTKVRQEGVAALLNQPRFMEWDFDMILNVDDRGLEAALDLVDREGRHISFRIRENYPGRELSAILAPVSSGTLEPRSFPMVYLDEFSMVLVKHTEISILIGGRRRRPVIFPLLVNGERVYYSRYSSRVAIADLLPESTGLLAFLQLEPGQETIRQEDCTWQFRWNGPQAELVRVSMQSGTSTVGIQFQPGLPNPYQLREAARAEGRFLISVNGIPAVIGGDYTMDRSRWVLQPLQAWQPPGMGAVPWVSTFRFEASLDIPVGSMTSTWNRTDGIRKPR
jgi:hypothetical protein